MAKRKTWPQLLEKCSRIELSYLWNRYSMRWPKRIDTTLCWTRNGKPCGSVGLIIDTREMYIELYYLYGGEPRHYRVDMVSVPSNLGAGKVWYFVCPQTKRRCRVLYEVNGWFFHRAAFRGCFYEKQTYSKRDRLLDYTVFPRMSELSDRLDRCRKTYRQKPTRRYKSLIQRIEKCERTQRVIYQSLMRRIENNERSLRAAYKNLERVDGG